MLSYISINNWPKKKKILTLYKPNKKYTRIQGIYEENYRTLKKERKEDIKKWRDRPWSWIKRLNIVRMSVLLDLIYRFNQVPIKIPASYVVDINKLILKII